MIGTIWRGVLSQQDYTLSSFVSEYGDNLVAAYSFRGLNSPEKDSFVAFDSDIATNLSFKASDIDDGSVVSRLTGVNHYFKNWLDQSNNNMEELTEAGTDTPVLSSDDSLVKHNGQFFCYKPDGAGSFLFQGLDTLTWPTATRSVIAVFSYIPEPLGGIWRAGSTGGPDSSDVGLQSTSPLRLNYQKDNIPTTLSGELMCITLIRKSSSTADVYKNGKLLLQDVTTSASANDGLVVGARNSIDGEITSMDMLEVLVYDEDLTGSRLTNILANVGNYYGLDMTADSGILPNLVAHYTMDEGSGTRYDSHGGFDLTDVTGVLSGTGVLSNAALLSSVNTDRLTRTPNDIFTGTGACTISLLFNTTSNGYLCGFGGTAGVGTRLDIVIEFGALGVRCSSNSVNFGLGGLTDGVWHHLVLVKPENATVTELSAFIDDAYQTPNSPSGSDILNISSTRAVVGRNSQDNATPFNGRIDEFAVWSRELSPSEITFIYDDYTGDQNGYGGW